MLRFSYPASVTTSDDGYVVTFRDVPEAVTGGATYDEALQAAVDALAVALDGYIESGQSIPQPTPRHIEEVVVTVPPVRAGALLLKQATVQQSIPIHELAGRLGKTERQTRRVLSGRGSIDQVITALEALGLRVEMRVVSGDQTYEN